MRARTLGCANKDQAHLFGLFHDCGKVLLMQRLPNYQETLTLAANSNTKHLALLENEAHGTNHCLAGKLLAKVWVLPESVSEAIAHHHDIDVFTAKKLPNNVMNLIAINHLAEYITNVESVYNDSEWVKFNMAFKDHLLLSENELDDFWSIGGGEKINFEKQVAAFFSSSEVGNGSQKSSVWIHFCHSAMLRPMSSSFTANSLPFFLKPNDLS